MNNIEVNSKNKSVNSRARDIDPKLYSSSVNVFSFQTKLKIKESISRLNNILKCNYNTECCINKELNSKSLVLSSEIESDFKRIQNDFINSNRFLSLRSSVNVDTLKQVIQYISQKRKLL